MPATTSLRRVIDRRRVLIGLAALGLTTSCSESTTTTSPTNTSGAPPSRTPTPGTPGTPSTPGTPAPATSSVLSPSPTSPSPSLDFPTLGEPGVAQLRSAAQTLRGVHGQAIADLTRWPAARLNAYTAAISAQLTAIKASDSRLSDLATSTTPTAPAATAAAARGRARAGAQRCADSLAKIAENPATEPLAARLIAQLAASHSAFFEALR